MSCSLALKLLALSLVCSLSAAEPKPKPQFYPLFPGAPPPPPYSHFLPPHPLPADSAQSASQEWSRTPQTHNNLSTPSGDPSFIDPLSFPAGEEFLKNDIPRQIYGLPPPTQGQGGYPQIYRIDNLIIIANPVQNRPQPCIPQQPPYQPGGGNLDNRFGNDQTPEPNPCTWAIVACCSPGSDNIRYSCFELFQCLGAFVGRSPCNRVVVEEAAKTALAYYSRNNNNSNNSTAQVFNQI